MYWWCFFHNQMCAIHHRNWHLWHYNRFLLINWYTAGRFGRWSRIPNRTVRLDISRSNAKNYTQSFYDHVVKLVLFRFKTAKITNKCGARDASRWMRELWNMLSISVHRVCNVALLKKHQRKNWCMLWLIYFWLCTWMGAAVGITSWERKKQHTEAKEKNWSRYF